MKSAKFMFGKTTTILTYDLAQSNISAEKICDENPMFHTTFYVKGNIPFNLPSSTLLTIQNKDDAEKGFRDVVNKLDPNAKIKKLFILNVSDMDAFIEENEWNFM